MTATPDADADAGKAQGKERCPIDCPHCGAFHTRNGNPKYAYACGSLPGVSPRTYICDHASSLRAANARLAEELAEARRPWTASLSVTGSNGLPDYCECEVIDVGHADHILLIRCPELESQLAALRQQQEAMVPRDVALRACETIKDVALLLVQYHIDKADKNIREAKELGERESTIDHAHSQSFRVLLERMKAVNTKATLDRICARALREAAQQRAAEVMAKHGVIQIGTSSGHELSPEAKIAICEKVLPIAHSALAEAAQPGAQPSTEKEAAP